ncbi:MAG: DNA polymerase III subunit delta [Candidatus Lernaella stagnicola]|nr:DNA polymerase III subunit delta [Candidatus Lernaella stagnicola]
MPLSHLDKSLADGLKPVYLIAGSQSYQLELARSMIVRHVPLGAMADMNTDVFYVGQDSLSTVPRLANSLPMMSKRRLIVLNAWHKVKAKERDALTEYLQSPADFTVLVLLAEKLDGRAKFTKLAKKYGLVLEFDRLYESKMRPWVAAIARDQEVDIDRDAVEYLVRAVGADLAAAAREIEKAAIHAGGKAVTADDLSAVMSSVKEQSFYELFDAVTARKTAEALRVVKEIIDQGQAPLGVLAMFGRALRQLVVARLLARDRVDDQQLARALGTTPWAAKKVKGQARAFSDAALRKALVTLSKVDLMLKDGRSHDRAILERMILDLCRRS